MRNAAWPPTSPNRFPLPLHIVCVFYHPHSRAEFPVLTAGYLFCTSALVCIHQMFDSIKIHGPQVCISLAGVSVMSSFLPGPSSSSSSAPLTAHTLLLNCEPWDKLVLLSSFFQTPFLWMLVLGGAAQECVFVHGLILASVRCFVLFWCLLCFLYLVFLLRFKLILVFDLVFVYVFVLVCFAFAFSYCLWLFWQFLFIFFALVFCFDLVSF